MPFSKDDYTGFFNDLNEDGFHIFSRENAKTEGFYPHQFPDFPEVDISTIKIGDRVAIRAFFSKTQSRSSPIESGYIDLEVEFIDYKKQLITANIITELPAHFALSTGTSIDLSMDEILQLNNP